MFKVLSYFLNMCIFSDLGSKLTKLVPGNKLTSEQQKIIRDK